MTLPPGLVDDRFSLYAVLGEWLPGLICVFAVAIPVFGRRREV